MRIEFWEVQIRVPEGVVPPNYVKICSSQISADVELKPFKNLFFVAPFGGFQRGGTPKQYVKIFVS